MQWGKNLILSKEINASQCWGSVTFWCGSGSPDLYLWLMDPDSTPDPTPFFIDFQDGKFFFHNFSYNLPTGTSSSFNFWLNFCVKILICRHFFSLLNKYIYEKREGSGSCSVPLTNGSGSGSGRPKTCRSWSGSPTLMQTVPFVWDSYWLEIWKNHAFPSKGPNGESLAMDSVHRTSGLPSTSFAAVSPV